MNEVATAGEDNQLFIWDKDTKQVLKSAIINEKKGIKRKRRKAGTTSTETPNRCVRAIAYSPDGAHLAVGCNSGEIHIFDAQSDNLDKLYTHNLNRFGKRNVKDQDELSTFTNKHMILCVYFFCLISFFF